MNPNIQSIPAEKGVPFLIFPPTADPPGSHLLKMKEKHHIPGQQRRLVEETERTASEPTELRVKGIQAAELPQGLLPVCTSPGLSGLRPPCSHQTTSRRTLRAVPPVGRKLPVRGKARGRAMGAKRSCKAPNRAVPELGQGPWCWFFDVSYMWG